MNSKTKVLRINSFNCAGIRNEKKRLNIFNWLNSTYQGITLLQETHSIATDEKKWQQEFKGTIYFSHGDYNARGTAICIPNQLQSKFEFISGKQDKEGRFILIECQIENNNIILII